MSLFWRLFLMMLATLVLVAASFVWLTARWETGRGAAEREIAQVRALGETAAGIFVRQGPEALARWLRRLEDARGVRGFLLDADGFNLLPMRFPRELVGVAREAVVEGRAVERKFAPFILIARPVNLGPETFFWTAIMRMTPAQMEKARRARFLLLVVLAVAAMLLLSLAITQMYLRPLRRLERSALRFGEGRLDARPDAELLARRDEFGKLARALATMEERIASLLDGHRRLLREISHELRSPLARLQVALELARNRAEAEPPVEELDRIEREAERLDAMIGEILTLSRFEQGVVELARERIELDRLLAELTRDAGFEAEAAGKTLELARLDACTVEGDRVWLARALENLVRNAIHHTPADCGVEVRLMREGRKCRIEVRDHGPGLAAEELAHLFEPFRRGRTQARGFGLGLAIARRIIEAHGGRIEARNHPEGGLAVTVRLPLAD